MTAADVPAIAAVHRRACLVGYAFMGWDYPLDVIEAWYVGKYPGWDFARIAECDGRVAGYLGAAGGLLDDLFIDPAFQRLGIGRALVAAQLARGIRPVTLEVYEDNAPARALYEAFGFIVSERFFNDVEGAWELRCSLG